MEGEVRFTPLNHTEAVQEYGAVLTGPPTSGLVLSPDDPSAGVNSGERPSLSLTGIDAGN